MQFKDIPVGERFEFADAVLGVLGAGRLTKTGVSEVSDHKGVSVWINDKGIETNVKKVGVAFDDGREIVLRQDLTLIWLRNGDLIDGPISIEDIINSGLANNYRLSTLLVFTVESNAKLRLPINRVDENTLAALLDIRSVTQPSIIKIVDGEPLLHGQCESVSLTKAINEQGRLAVKYFLQHETDYALAKTLHEHEQFHIKTINNY